MSTEKQLIERVRAFDQQTLAEVYDQFSPMLYRYAIRLLGDVDRAEECVAETFSRFLHALQRGRGPKEHLQAYLFRIAQNWITDYFRSQPTLPLFQEHDYESDTQTDPQSDVVDVHMKEQVRRALLQLTPDQRQVVILKFIEGWSNADVAKTMRKSIGAVKSLQHRGLETLNHLLAFMRE